MNYCFSVLASATERVVVPAGAVGTPVPENLALLYTAEACGYGRDIGHTWLPSNMLVHTQVMW